MKVLLLSPPYLPGYMRNARCDFVSLSATQWFPIWLGYCGCLLEKYGYKVRLIDAPAYGLGNKRVEEMFFEYKPDLLIVYTGAKSEGSDIEFVDKLLAKYNCPAVLVGPYFSITPIDTLAKNKKISFGISGEFEYPVLELLEGKNPREIKNLLWREDGIIKKNEERQYLGTKELDSIPFVSDFFNRHLDYRFYRTPSEYHPFIDIMTGRGCVWGICTFCLWVHSFIKGRVYNVRSIENVLEELVFIETKLPHIKSVMIQDDTFPSNRAREFSEIKLRLGIKIPWSCYARGDIDYETLKLMKEAGCRNLHVGYESANNVILRKLKKGLTKEQMTKFTQDAKRVGLRIHGDFAIGFPEETEDTIKETIKWACELRPHTAQFQLMIPFKGTPFYNKLRDKGCLNNGAPDYPDLSKEKMEILAKKAYRSFYIGLSYLFQAVRYPREHILDHFKIIRRSIPSMFWRKWDVR